MPHSKIARHGKRAMTVSSTGSSDSTSPSRHSTTRFASTMRVTLRVFDVRAADLLGRRPPQPGQLGLDVAKLDRDSLTFDERRWWSLESHRRSQSHRQRALSAAIKASAASGPQLPAT